MDSRFVLLPSRLALQSRPGGGKPKTDRQLLVVAEEVSLDTEKKALAHGADAVFPKEDDPAALAQNARAIYRLLRGENESDS